MTVSLGVVRATGEGVAGDQRIVIIYNIRNSSAANAQMPVTFNIN